MKKPAVPWSCFLIVLNLLLANPASAAPPDSQPPAAPGGLRAWVYEPDFFYLSWQAASDDIGVVAYRLYRNTELIATTTVRHFLDMEYDRDVFNAYWVTALDAAGNESPASTAIPDPRAD